MDNFAHERCIVSRLSIAGAAVAAVLFGGTVDTADAGLITGAALDGSSPGLGAVSFVTIAQNSEITKTFESAEHIDIVFTYEDFSSNGVTHSISETITNNSGVNWIGYKVLLGIGAGSSFTLGPPAGVTFTSKGGPFYSAFSGLSLSPDTLDFNTGTHSPGTSATARIMITIPEPGTPTTFTLRQIPQLATTGVPEPASLTLAVFGSMCVLGYGRRRASS